MNCLEEAVPNWVVWVVFPLCGVVALVMIAAIAFMLWTDRRKETGS